MHFARSSFKNVFLKKPYHCEMAWEESGGEGVYFGEGQY